MFGLSRGQNVGLFGGLIVALSASLAPAGVTTSAAATGGSFVAPGEQGTFDNGHGFGVYGDYGVLADGGVDIVVTIESSLDFPGLDSGYYQTGTFILGQFLSDNPTSTATVMTFYSYSYLDGQFASSISSAGFQNGLPPDYPDGVPMNSEISSGGSSGVFFLAAGDYTLRQITEVRIAGAVAGETVSYILPDPRIVVYASADSFLDPAQAPASVPEPGTFAIFGLGSLLFAGGGLCRRTRKSLAAAS